MEKKKKKEKIFEKHTDVKLKNRTEKQKYTLHVKSVRNVITYCKST